MPDVSWAVAFGWGLIVFVTYYRVSGYSRKLAAALWVLALLGMGVYQLLSQGRSGLLIGTLAAGLGGLVYSLQSRIAASALLMTVVLGMGACRWLWLGQPAMLVSTLGASLLTVLALFGARRVLARRS